MKDNSVKENRRDRMIIPKQKTAKFSKKWGKDTFLKAGESTFGD